MKLWNISINLLDFLNKVKKNIFFLQTKKNKNILKVLNFLLYFLVFFSQFK